MFMMVGHVIETNLESSTRLYPKTMRAVVNVVAADGREWLQVKQLRVLSSYDLANLNGLYCGRDARAVLRFDRPRRQVVMQSDTKTSLATLMRAVRAASRRQRAELDIEFCPNMDDFVSLTDYKTLRNDLGAHLNSIILENVDLTKLKDQIGILPVSYINLSGSKLDLSDRTETWDWMSSDLICNTLIMLVINSVGLNQIPFEILFLKNLQILSLASNKLKYLPHLLGDLKDLDCLFVDGNMLSYLPLCLKDKTFKHLNVTKNQLEKFVIELHENKKKQHLRNKRSSKNPVSVKLFYLSLFSVIDQCPKFKRKNLVHSIHRYFNLVYRCPDCNHLMIPDYSTEYYEFSHPSTINLVQSILIPWQSFECSYSKCTSLIQYFQNLV